MKKILAIVAFFALFCSFPLTAQVKRLSREAIDSIRNIRAVYDGDSILDFSTKIVDFGTVYESDSAFAVYYSFKNPSRERVVLKSVTANCGCIRSSCEKYEYEPGEEGVLRVDFNPKGRSGTVDKNIFVYALTAKDFYSDINGEIKNPMLVAKLTLLGNVVDKNEWRHLPESMGDLRLKRKTVVFEPIRSGTSPQMRIMCANVGTTPLRLYSRMLPSFMTFATEPLELAPGEEGDIVITIDGDRFPEKGNKKYHILVEGVEGRISDRMIEIKIENN